MNAETIVLTLCRTIIGDGRKDRGLMTQIKHGQQHIPTCQVGQYIAEGDSLRGGQPCSQRCQDAREALRAASRWLKAHEKLEQCALIGEAV